MATMWQPAARGERPDRACGRVSKGVLASSALALLMAAAPSALAQEVDPRIEALERQVEGLQRQLRELRGDMIEQQQQAATVEIPEEVVESGGSGLRLSISGQVNRGILVGDDGEDTNVFFVDNDNSSTRLRFVGEADVSEDFTVGTNIEVEMESNSTASVNQNEQDTGTVSFKDRKLEIYAEHVQFGKGWLGQGSTASDGTSEVDLSGTTVIGYSSVVDMAGGLLFRERDGELSDVNIGSVFSNFDGLGRQDRIRYDSPKLAGFQLSTSAIADQRYDFAARYAAKFKAVTLAAAAAYARDQPNSRNQFNGSVSALLGEDTGLFEGVSLTFASGLRDSDDTGRDNATFLYGKLGYEIAPFSWGSTAFGLDYERASNVAQNGDKADSVGLFGVQEVSAISTDLYLGYRWHQLRRDAVNFDNINAVLTGARVKF